MFDYQKRLVKNFLGNSRAENYTKNVQKLRSYKSLRCNMSTKLYVAWFHDNPCTDISSIDISSTTVYQRAGQLYIELLFQQIIIFINSNFYLHYDSFCRWLDGVVGLKLPLALAAAVRVPYTTSPCSDLGQVVNLSWSVD